MLNTLQDFLPIIRDLGDRECLRCRNRYRTRKFSYREVYRQVAALSEAFRERGLKRGDRILLWGESGAEWIMAFWASVARGLQVVPVDARFSRELVEKIQSDAGPQLRVVDEARAALVEGDKLTFGEIASLRPRDEISRVDLQDRDVAEIVYTSGTTGTPKGVPHRHRNICANLGPFQKELEKYRWMARPFQPVRILDLLPLSHLFGQALGIFIPPLLGGSAVFTKDLHPGAVVRTIREERISALVCVPRLLEQLRDRMEKRHSVSDRKIRWEGWPGAVEKWWKFRALHAELGWKFWSVIVGGAVVEESLEDFWHRVGIVTIQGYGLTEASPVVAVNHPFSATRGSLGKPLKGQEVKIAEDGEILVRGESVVSGYFQEEDRSDGGWLHTGDIGRFDEQGRLYYRGRKKDLIVTSEGANVHPEDVEAVLNRLSEIEETCVVGKPTPRGEVVHAELILAEEAADPADLVRRANRHLEDHQKVKSWSLWESSRFPRTPSTQKLRRAEVARKVGRVGRGAEESEEEDPLTRILGRLSGTAPSQIDEEMRLGADLGLTSLDLVELLSALEEECSVELEETQLQGEVSVGDLRSLVDERRSGKKSGGPESPARKGRTRAEEPTISMPSWSLGWAVRGFRRLFQSGLMLPLFHHYIELRTTGEEIFEQLEPPFLLAANHNSHLDTVAILAAVPANLRTRIAPAMVRERFLPHFAPKGFSFSTRLKASIQYALACALFQAYPLPQRVGGIRHAIRYTGGLVDRGYCPLVFPEGRRSEDGELQSFQPGIGLMSKELDLPVIPIYIEGMFEVFSLHMSWPRGGNVRIGFGEPIRSDSEESYEELVHRLEERIREEKRG